eukprot:scaffold115235_cov70-Cyclotella_meneghiniana.AAC.9
MAQVFKRHKIIVKTATDNLEYHRNPSRHDDETSHHDSCFQARKNTMHVSGHLHGTFINVGMPKMGSTSLHKYFCCGNHTSSHWECGKGKGLCADCMKNAAASGLKPLESCGLPSGKGGNEVEMSSFFCNHVKNIRTFVQRHPTHTLIELDITSNSTDNNTLRPALIACGK